MPNTKMMPGMEYRFTRRSHPRRAMTVFSRPVLGDPRIAHATAPTSGGTNSGSIPAAPISALHGVSVRTVIQANARPMTTASTVPPVQATSEFHSAKWTLPLPSTRMKLAIDRSDARMPSTMGSAFVSAPSSSVATG